MVEDESLYIVFELAIRVFFVVIGLNSEVWSRSKLMCFFRVLKLCEFLIYVMTHCILRLVLIFVMNLFVASCILFISKFFFDVILGIVLYPWEKERMGANVFV